VAFFLQLSGPTEEIGPISVFFPPSGADVQSSGDVIHLGALSFFFSSFPLSLLEVDGFVLVVL